jgi:hypothetical protein
VVAACELVVAAENAKGGDSWKNTYVASHKKEGDVWVLSVCLCAGDLCKQVKANVNMSTKEVSAGGKKAALF